MGLCCPGSIILKIQQIGLKQKLLHRLAQRVLLWWETKFFIVIILIELYLSQERQWGCAVLGAKFLKHSQMG